MGPSASRPARLSRERIADAAIAIADAEGIEALSMRRLARALGSEAMSLYHYTPSKEDLLGVMVDHVLADMVPPAPGGDWRAAVRAAMVFRRSVLARHPWAAARELQGGRATPAGLRQMEALLETLGAAGFTGELADHAYHAIEVSVLGFSLWENGAERAPADGAPNRERSAPAAPSRDAWPASADHFAFHGEPSAGQQRTTFELCLDLLLDGLERMRVEAATEAGA